MIFFTILDRECQKTYHRGPVFRKEIVLQWSMQRGQGGGREPKARGSVCNLTQDHCFFSFQHFYFQICSGDEFLSYDYILKADLIERMLIFFSLRNIITFFVVRLNGEILLSCQF